MATSREIAPKLHKDIWLNLILPSMDEKTLLDFSAASKETRQIAFAELFKRPTFAHKINYKIHRDSQQRDVSNLEKWAQWGLGTDAQIYRYAQYACLGLSMTFLAALAERSLYDHPMRPLLSQEAATTLSVMGSVSMAGISLIFRGLFLHENRVTNSVYEDELKYQATREERSERFTYLRDELPKQSVTTHSLFRKFVDTSENSEEKWNSCTIL